MNASTTSPVPPGCNTVNGFIVVKGATEFIEFVIEVFGGTETPEAHTPDFYANDGTLIHAEVRIGNSVVMIADRKEGWPFTPALTQVYVADAEETLRRAVDRGATVVTEVSPFYGGFEISRFLDPWRNLWWLFTPTASDPAESAESTEEWTADSTDEADAGDWENSEPGPVYTTLLDAMRQLDDPT